MSLVRNQRNIVNFATSRTPKLVAYGYCDKRPTARPIASACVSRVCQTMLFFGKYVIRALAS
eukprot:6188442-Pleurochrysis_carterae.AAC.6